MYKKNMKKILLLLAVFSSSVFAHGQSPILYGGKKHPLEAITLTGWVNVPISVIERENPEQFVIYSDNHKFRTIHTDRAKYYNLSVPVKANKPNTPEVHTVCSVSSGTNTGNVSTRICTTVQIYWKKDK